MQKLTFENWMTSKESSAELDFRCAQSRAEVSPCVCRTWTTLTVLRANDLRKLRADHHPGQSDG